MDDLDTPRCVALQAGRRQGMPPSASAVKLEAISEPHNKDALSISQVQCLNTLSSPTSRAQHSATTPDGRIDKLSRDEAGITWLCSTSRVPARHCSIQMRRLTHRPSRPSTAVVPQCWVSTDTYGRDPMTVLSMPDVLPPLGQRLSSGIGLPNLHLTATATLIESDSA